MKNILLCGVGGQGTVLASRLLASAAMARGEFAVTAETIGMAQRGGSVVSHVRTGREDEVFSPLIAEGTADVIIGFEPGEVVRNLRFLKKGGTVVVCDKAAYAVTTPLYDGREAIEFLKNNIKQCYIIDAAQIENTCKTIRVLNVALVGAAVQSGEVGGTLADIESVLSLKIKPQLLDVNKKALAVGAGMVGR